MLQAPQRAVRRDKTVLLCSYQNFCFGIKGSKLDYSGAFRGHFGGHYNRREPGHYRLGSLCFSLLEVEGVCTGG
jgi:hypothetical protein